MKEGNRCELGANGVWRPVGRRYTVVMVGLYQAGHWVCRSEEALVNLVVVEVERVLGSRQQLSCRGSYGAPQTNAKEQQESKLQKVLYTGTLTVSWLRRAVLSRAVELPRR